MSATPFVSSLEEHIEEVLAGSSVAFVMKATGAGLSFAFNIVLARLLGADGAGVYYLALTVTTVAGVLARLGLDNASMRFVAANASSGDWRKVKGVYRGTMRLSVVAGVILAVAVFLLADVIAGAVFDEPALAGPLRLMSVGIPAHCLLVLHTSVLKGVKRIRSAMLLKGFGVPLLSIPLLALLAGPLGVTGAVAAWVTAAYVVALGGWLLWRKATPDLESVTPDFSRSRLLSTSMPLLLVASMQLVMNWTDTVMLGIWTASDDVGIYNAAMKTAMLMTFALMAVNSIAAPKFSEMYAAGEIAELGDLARDLAKLLSAGILPLALVFLLLPTTVLTIFGPEFAVGGTALVILTVGQFVNVATGSVGYLLMMTGNEKDMRNITAGVAVLNVVLNLVLVPRFGIEGAAVATGTSLALTNLVAAYVVYRRLSIVTLPLVPRGYG